MPEKLSKSLQKIASSAPIIGAPIAEERKLHRLVSDTSKFLAGVLLMTLVNVYMSNHMNDDDTMDMGSMNMDDSNESMNMSFLDMFFIMYASMRIGAMFGEIFANFLSYCYENKQVPEDPTWRDKFIPQNMLTPLPIIGPFFASAKPADWVQHSVMDISMYTLGTLAMMWPGLNSFSNIYVNWGTAVARMYIGMAIGMVGTAAIFECGSRLYKSCTEDQVETSRYEPIDTCVL